MRLSAHFDSTEFDCHDGTPVPAYAMDDLRRLCTTLLEPLRRTYGPVVVISGYRHAAYNAKVGGAPASWHIYRRDRGGAAADIACKTGRPAGWYATLERLGAGGLGRYATHVHVDTRPGRARW